MIVRPEERRSFAGNKSRMMRFAGSPRPACYDTASRVTSLTLGNHSALIGSQNYGYDELDRVTAYTGTGGPLGYTYDASGNRLTQTVNGTLTTYTVSPGSNRYTATTTGSSHPAFGYDANGSRINRSTTTYGYDAAGRLASFVSSNKTAAYVYNGTGARVMKTVNGVATLFAYDEAGHLTGDYTATGSASVETIYLGDLPVAVLKGSVKYYVHADYRNAPRQIDDANRVAVWTWNPLPFGENVAVANPLSYNLRFPGQYFDSESGLFQNGYRDYDPAAGQYVESDLIGLAGGINTYAYVGGNPVFRVDRLGLAPDFPIPGFPGMSMQQVADYAAAQAAMNSPAVQQAQAQAALNTLRTDGPLVVAGILAIPLVAAGIEAAPAICAAAPTIYRAGKLAAAIYRGTLGPLISGVPEETAATEAKAIQQIINNAAREATQAPTPTLPVPTQPFP